MNKKCDLHVPEISRKDSPERRDHAEEAATASLQARATCPSRQPGFGEPLSLAGTCTARQRVTEPAAPALPVPVSPPDQG